MRWGSLIAIKSVVEEKDDSEEERESGRAGERESGRAGERETLSQAPM
jgi:hypothetical protein